MSVLGAILGRYADDYITIGMVIFLIIAAMYFAGFDVSGAISNFQNIAKYIVGFAAGASGVYVLHKTQQTRGKADDILGAIIGIALVGFGASIAFGGTVVTYLSQATETVKAIIPYAIGGALALVGAQIAQGRSKTSEIVGIIMIVLGLSMLGLKISGIIG